MLKKALRLRVSRYLLILLMAITLYDAAMLAQDRASKDYLWYDPDKIVKAEPCGECHKAEYEVWQGTKHAEAFRSRHREKRAEEIGKKLGFKFIKRESLCLKCHYTATREKEQLRAISGVSCESCHGPGKDWKDIHNEYGKGYNQQTETAEHKAQRIAESKANGMLRPSELYGVVANCFQCHTVPHETLVNVGGHGTGTTDFEFLSRMDEIRHNFLQAQFDPSRTENVERTPARKRVMFVVSRALDLEYSIRGAAVGKEKGTYFKAMQRRVRSAVNKLRAITKRIALPEVQEMLTTVGKVNIKPNNDGPLLAAAAKIGSATKRFIKNYDGTQLEKLDAHITGTEEVIVEAPPVTDEVPESGGSPTAETKPLKAGSTQETVERQDQPNYKKKRSIRPRSKHKTIGPSCESCHKDQNKWWETDRHYASIDPFVNRAQKNIKIARLYGLSVSEMTKGNQLCMDCHGTVISGQESDDVFDGVSCESCHGPAGDYKKPHSAENPPNGYSVGKDFGMLLLEDVDARARACAQCHYITDPRLISTGHPTGRDFSFVQRNEKINHWPTGPNHGSEALKAAYGKEKQRRGGIPQVTLATVTVSSSSRRQGSQRVTSTSQPARRISERQRPVVIQSQPLPVRKASINLEPFPAISDSTSVEELLLILKERLELLYQEVGRGK